MSRQNYIFTSESVSEGHPDKVLRPHFRCRSRRVLAKEPRARCRLRNLRRTSGSWSRRRGRARKPGALRSFHGHHKQIASDCIRTSLRAGKSLEHLHGPELLHEQSRISRNGGQRVESKGTSGAGRSGDMLRFDAVRRDAGIHARPDPLPRDPRRSPRPANRAPTDACRPDRRSQHSVRYEDGKPVEVTSIVLSTQHEERGPDLADIPRSSSLHSPSRCPRDWLTAKTEWPCEPPGLRDRRPTATRGSRARKMHRRHLGGRAPPTWRRVLRQSDPT